MQVYIFEWLAFLSILQYIVYMCWGIIMNITYHMLVGSDIEYFTEITHFLLSATLKDTIYYYSFIDEQTK